MCRSATLRALAQMRTRMTRAAIPLPQDLPEPIRTLVVERIEPVLADVRTLLALPRVPGSPSFVAAAASSGWAMMWA